MFVIWRVRLCLSPVSDRQAGLYQHAVRSCIRWCGIVVGCTWQMSAPPLFQIQILDNLRLRKHFHRFNKARQSRRKMTQIMMTKGGVNKWYTRREPRTWIIHISTSIKAAEAKPTRNVPLFLIIEMFLEYYKSWERALNASSTAGVSFYPLTFVQFGEQHKGSGV